MYEIHVKIEQNTYGQGDSKFIYSYHFAVSLQVYGEGYLYLFPSLVNKNFQNIDLQYSIFLDCYNYY